MGFCWVRVGRERRSARCARDGGLKDESKTAMSMVLWFREFEEEKEDGEKGQEGVVE